MKKLDSFFCGLGKFYALAVIVCVTIAAIDAVQTSRAVAKLASDPANWTFPEAQPDFYAQPIPIIYQGRDEFGRVETEAV